MKINSHFHVTYCTNVHPGSDWKTTFKAIASHLDNIKEAVSPDTPFGLGLRLSDKASRELDEGNRLEQFRDWLQSRNTYVFTMNGFPYGNFHGQPVKDQVHFPDWTTVDRLTYTTRLFKQLAYLLPKGLDGGISTSPVSYKYWHKSVAALDVVLKQGARQMAEVALQLVSIEAASGTYLHLDIEPEPDGLLENTADVLQFFEQYLLPEGITLFMEVQNITASEARNLLLRHITLCYDVCHFALAFETPQNVFSKLAQAGIRIGKIQVSAALKIPNFDPGRAELIAALEAFNEPVYLHQVTAQTEDGIKTWSDLPELFKETDKYDELRAHFHVPIFMEDYGLLGSTQPEIIEVLEYLKLHSVCHHLEVETYTWDVLPGKKEPLAESISREINWLRSHLEV